MPMDVEKVLERLELLVRLKRAEEERLISNPLSDNLRDKALEEIEAEITE